MPYINKNPFDDDKTLFFFKVLIFALIIFYLIFGLTKIAFGAGEGDYVDLIGYYSSPETSAIIPDNYYIFDTTATAHYLGYEGLVSGHNFYGAPFRGVVGNSTTINSHNLGILSVPFDYELVGESWDIYPQQGEDFFILVADATICDPIQDLYDYLATGGPVPCSAFGTIPFKWGIDIVEHDINFTSPIGLQEETAPFLLSWQGDYEIASSSVYWTEIEIELTHYSPPGYNTSTIDSYFIALQNAQNKGVGSFDTFGYPVIDGIYTYRARFAWTIFDYTASTTDWLYDNDAYWTFSVGVEGGGLPEMGDYDFTDEDFGYLGNMFRDVLVWLFKPSSEVLDYWKTIKDDVADKPPFGYYSLVKESFDNLSSQSTPAFSLMTASSTANYIFDPLKTGLQWIFWILFGVWFIKRFVHFVV